MTHNVKRTDAEIQVVFNLWHNSDCARAKQEKVQKAEKARLAQERAIKEAVKHLQGENVHKDICCVIL